MKLTQTIIAAATVVAMALPGTAGAEKVLDYSYNIKGETPSMYGFAKRETYDVAIRLNDPALVGCKVTGFYVAAPSAGVTDYSGWLSTELKLNKKVNAPDITSKPATVGDDEMLRVDFDEPYTITEKGVYVGYSLTVSELLTEFGAYPVALVEGVNTDGFYLHTSRSRLKWYEASEVIGGVSTMVVRIAGDFSDNSAGVETDEVLYAPAGKESKVDITLSNHGVNPITSIDYSYTAGTESGSGSVKLAQPVAARFGATGEASISIKALPECGDYDFTVTIDKVNGVENPDKLKTATTTLSVIPFVPVNRPLVEEYTGLWCGYCPVGYVALETLHKKYDGAFVAVAYHDGDDMATVENFPSYVDGFPTSYINRGYNEVYPGDLVESWPAFRKAVPAADIDVAVEWADEAKTTLSATSTFRFVKDTNAADLKVGYILVEDGMSNPDWEQSNYLSGDTSLEGECADLFVYGDDKVKGLEFNDVVVSAKGILGVDGSVPADVKSDTPYTHSFSFKINDALNLDGKVAVQNPDKLRVVAFLIDSYADEVINSNTSDYADGGEYTGIKSVGAGNGEVVGEEFYDLQGRRVFKPAAGLYLKSQKMSDGSNRVTKVMVR